MIRLNITKTGINGEGIGFYKRKPVFVDGCFKDEVVSCELIDEGRHYRGRLIKVLKFSKERVRTLCPLQKLCGACNLMAVNYKEQLRIKKELLEGALDKYYRHIDVPDVVASDKIICYRNKCNLPFFESQGKLVNALYHQGSNHPIFFDECVIHEEKVEQIRKKVLQILNDHQLKVYDHKIRKGLRQLVIRGFADQYQLVLISGNDRFDKKLIEDLLNIQDVVSVYQGINTVKNPLHLMNEKIRCIGGKKKITFSLGTYKLSLSPDAFFQLNENQADRIYTDVSRMIDSKVDTIVEAYSGIGAISLYLHGKAKEVIGIELIESAVKDAKENVLLNGIENISFVCDDASKALRKIAKHKPIDVLVVDPPRSGLDDEILTTILKTGIRKIIYISCNPATLAKNLEVLSEKYEVRSIQPYDMFPQTAHVETVVLLSKVEKSTKKIHVDFSLEGMDLSGLKEGATYEEKSSQHQRNRNKGEQVHTGGRILW